MQAIITDILTFTPMYGLIGLGFVLVYSVSGVLNFAHLGVFQLGGYVTYQVVKGGGQGPVLSLLAGILASCLCGLLIYRFVIRPLEGRPVFASVLATFAVTLMIQSILAMYFTSASLSLPAEATHWFTAQTEIFPGVVLERGKALTAVIYAVVLVAFLSLLRFTDVGVQGRAAAENPLLAGYRGIRLDRLNLIVWTVASGLGGLAGGMYVFNQPASPSMSITAVNAFPGAMLGGLDSVIGTLVGSLIVAFGKSVALQQVGSMFADVLPFILVLIVLAIRPWGIFGHAERTDRV